jgi:hypothetical protein
MSSIDFFVQCFLCYLLASSTDEHISTVLTVYQHLYEERNIGATPRSNPCLVIGRDSNLDFTNGVLGDDS